LVPATNISTFCPVIILFETGTELFELVVKYLLAINGALAPPAIKALLVNVTDAEMVVIRKYVVDNWNMFDDFYKATKDLALKFLDLPNENVNAFNHIDINNTLNQVDAYNGNDFSYL
jgi:hypothetical protein